MKGDRRVPEGAKGRATRQAFIDAARRVFARNGYLRARITDIADEAGKSVAAFYNYFDNKAQLLAELALDFNTELQQLVVAPYRAGLSSPEALREALAAFWFHYKNRLPDIVAIFQASMVDEEFAARWQEIRASGVSMIAAGVRRAQSEGYCDTLNPDLAASALTAMLEYFSYVWLFQGGEVKSITLSDDLAIDTLWQLWSHAVYWNEAIAVPGEASQQPALKSVTSGRR
jgi:AcrR family transcriptional regulator